MPKLPTTLKARVCIAATVALSFVAVASTHDKAVEKPGYMIVIGEGVDPAKMGAYAQAAVPLLLKAGGELMFVTDEGKTEVIEGAPFPGSIRVLRFPSIEAARDFYYSDEYQAAIPLRAGNGKLQVMLADGWIPDPKWLQQDGN